jgi:hypothetical protein
MGVILGVLLIVGCLFGMCVLDGVVLQVMWGWFIVPFGLPPISIAMAIGLGAIVNLMSNTHVPKIQDGDEIEEFVGRIVNWLIKLVLMLAIGWIAHKCL